jgi:hypothetical protein
MSLKIESLDPLYVKVGWEGTLNIYGRDLGEAGFVAIDGNSPKIESWTTSQIRVRVTKSVTGTAGKKRVVVHDRDGNFDETQWSVEA